METDWSTVTGPPAGVRSLDARMVDASRRGFEEATGYHQRASLYPASRRWH